MTTQSDVPLAGTSAPVQERDLVLAVDDNEQNLRLIAAVLAKRGFEMLEASDATTAVATTTTASCRHARATANASTTAANVQSEKARTSWPSPSTTPVATASCHR